MINLYVFRMIVCMIENLNLILSLRLDLIMHVLTIHIHLLLFRTILLALLLNYL